MVCTAFRRSTPFPVSSSSCRSPSERAPCLVLASAALISFVIEDTAASALHWKQIDPAAAVILEKCVLVSSLNCWHSDESEHLGKQ